MNLIWYAIGAILCLILLFLSVLHHRRRILPKLGEDMRHISETPEAQAEETNAFKQDAVVQSDPFEGLSIPGKREPLRLGKIALLVMGALLLCLLAALTVWRTLCPVAEEPPKEESSQSEAEA